MIAESKHRKPHPTIAAKYVSVRQSLKNGLTGKRDTHGAQTGVTQKIPGDSLQKLSRECER